MPEQATIERARRDAREGKSPSTQAGEFVREEMHHIREGKHGARSSKQAIAIGLSMARRAGVKLGAPRRGTTSPQTRRKATADLVKGRSGAKPSPIRSRARIKALKKESHRAAAKSSLSPQAKQAARRRGPKARAQAARKSAQTRHRLAD